MVTEMTRSFRTSMILELYRNGVMTAKGFALNYEMKLRSQEAYEWMARVSAEATHEDVVLVGEDEELKKAIGLCWPR